MARKQVYRHGSAYERQGADNGWSQVNLQPGVWDSANLAWYSLSAWNKRSVCQVGTG